MIVIFDWDGTLCDSADHIALAMGLAAEERGLAAPGDEAVHNIIGLSLPQAVQILFPELPEAEWQPLGEAYSRHFRATEGEIRLFEGALETLHALRGRGLELAVATGKSRRGLDRVLGVLEMAPLFHSSRCADETRSKPDPLMLREILTERGKSPEDALMVGDTEYDLEMAARAGVRSVGVSHGVHHVERLQRHDPVAIVDRLEQLLGLEDLQAGS